METDLTPQTPERLSPLLLAYIGDAVYELKVREHLLDSGETHMDKLHTAAVAYVRAERQSELIAALEGWLTSEEQEVFRRGRNAKSGRQPPHASVGAYRRATGLEALIGWLHLQGRTDRLAHIFSVLFRGEEA